MADILKTPLLIALLVTAYLADAQNPIDSAGMIKIGGIDQYVQVKGTDNSKPLLLFLHGGPGNSVISYAEKFTSELQKHFIVVQWDQRETGQTLARNKSNLPLTVAQFESDTHSLIDSLLKRFNQPKLYLAGHSWGTVLGFYIAKNYPELLYAYIPICPMIDQLESERIILELMREKASKEKNQKAIAELSTVKIPFETGEQLYLHRKWLLDFNGAKAFSKTRVITWTQTWLPVFNEASKNNLMKTTTVLRCPVYFCVGRKDYQTNSLITKKYFDLLNAPKKDLFWFENSGHSVPSSEPTRLQQIIVTKILSETYLKN
jgi:pimeloyl-ACP methyl ester carboxylesterase